ncbi:MAG: LytR/AlgR family response regulator transcription factor [Mangrovibacterium sp.]
MTNIKLKVLIVDDEKDARDILRYYLNDIPAVAEIEEASNVEEAVFKYLENKPDIVFLDIMMPGRTGADMIEILKRREPDCQIIIVSNHRDNAIMAIQNNVYDFILKPIDFSILAEKLDKYYLRKEASMEERLRKIVFSSEQGTKLRISSVNSHTIVDPNELIYCIADGSYTYLYLDGGIRELANTYLGKIELALPENRFFRLSRKILINLDKLTHVDRVNRSCTLKGGNFVVKLTGAQKQIKILLEMDLD